MDERHANIAKGQGPLSGEAPIRSGDPEAGIPNREAAGEAACRREPETPTALDHDPMAEDPRYAAAVAAASEQAERELERHPLHGGLGFCRVLWLRKKQILWQHYGIEWLSPADRNPYVLFE